MAHTAKTSRSTFRTHLLSGGAVGIIAALTMLPAAAQSNGANDASASNAKADTVETIVVTAERRAINLQKAGLAATVLTGEDLQKKNVTSLDQLQFTTPDLTIQDAGGTVLLNIRGIGKSDGGQQVPPGALIYRNGAPVTPGGIIGNEPYYDIGSVEVLRGPQGTFAGENATGGAIFITENRPSLDSLSGSVEAQYGNYDDMRLRGVLNVPLTDTLAIRIATNNENRDSFSKVTGTWTGNPGKLHETDWRLGVLWQPVEPFKAVLTTDYNYIDFGGTPAAPSSISTKNIFNVTSDAKLQGIENQIRTVLEMSYEFEDGITLKSTGSYQLGHIAIAKDVDGSATAFPGIIQQLVSSDNTWSEEVNLISPDTGRFTWVIGGTYIFDKVYAPAGHPQQLVYTPAALNYGFDLLNYTANKTNWGAFADGKYAITDALKLEVGLRYSETSFTLNSLTKYMLGNITIPLPPPLPAQVIPVNLWQLVKGEEQTDSRLTGKVNLEWQVSDSNFLYAFVATGHKGGGINGIGAAILGGTVYPPTACVTSPVNTCPPTFKPEEVTDYEIGWKGTYFNDQLHTQLGGFYSDYQNFQVAVFDPSTNIGQVKNAHGHSTIAGIEASAQAQFGDLGFDVGVSYLHSALGTFFASQTAAICDPATGPAGGACKNVTGNEQPNAAPWTAQGGLQYAFHLDGDQTLTPRIDYSLVGPRWTSIFDNPLTDHIVAQNLFNAQVIYDRADNWQVTLYATNLFDLHYAISQGSLFLPGAPRQFGIRVMKAF